MEARRRFPPIGDLGSSVNPLRILAQLAADLRSIRKHTISMDREVIGRHASVERIEVEMRELTARISELDGRMASGGVGRDPARAAHRRRQPRDPAAQARARAPARAAAGR
jgi:hypothetical protein